jgi:steroid 5-alpha reductase family enzyme
VTRSASLTRIAAAYVVALAVALAWVTAGPGTGRLWLDALIADLLATLVVFVFSRAHKNSSFYDAYWSVAPPLLLAFWWVSADPVGETARAVLVATVVVVWSVRLTANWVVGFPGLHHEDWRYPLLRERAGRWELPVDLLAIHVVPTLQVFLGMLPVYVVLTRPGRAVGWLDVVAVLVGLGAIALEAVSDLQMRRFVRQRTSGEVMDRGLWGWSRHPNYLGELGLWVSLGLFGVAASPGDAWWLFVGALAMLAMFLGASIPMMEQRSLERRPDYQDVVDRVPRFLPRPPGTRARRSRTSS